MRKKSFILLALVLLVAFCSGAAIAQDSATPMVETAEKVVEATGLNQTWGELKHAFITALIGVIGIIGTYLAYIVSRLVSKLLGKFNISFGATIEEVVMGFAKKSIKYAEQMAKKKLKETQKAMPSNKKFEIAAGKFEKWVNGLNLGKEETAKFLGEEEKEEYLESALQD